MPIDKHKLSRETARQCAKAFITQVIKIDLPWNIGALELYLPGGWKFDDHTAVGYDISSAGVTIDNVARVFQRHARRKVKA
jgi:hypothetical protein